MSRIQDLPRSVDYALRFALIAGGTALAAVIATMLIWPVFR